MYNKANVRNTRPFQVMQPLIELAMAQTSSRGAYIYRFDPDGETASVAEYSGPALFENGGEHEPIGGVVAAYHRKRNAPIVLQERAWTDQRFAALAEFRAHRFEGVVSVPLLDRGAAIGMANFCWIESRALRARELTLLLELSLPLATLLTVPILRAELDRTAQQLAARKVLERAKGLLQESLGFTEAQAYMQIRLWSRRQRTPMRQIAERLVQSSKQGEGERA
ncbi:MAG TPA: ANTAR domain-containing protein [Bryobacteraceae bacterium]|nr:ANTAR domain-containing protein [Bryobacteraceae bacterium]